MIDFKFGEVGDFHQGRTWVKNDSPWALIDKKGKLLTPFKYGSYVHHIYGSVNMPNQYFDTENDALDTYVIEEGSLGDKKSVHISGKEFDDYRSFKDGRLMVALEDDKTPYWLGIDKTGKVLTKRTSLNSFRRNLKQGDEVSFLRRNALIIDVKGKLVQIQNNNGSEWVKREKIYPVNHYKLPK